MEALKLFWTTRRPRPCIWQVIETVSAVMRAMRTGNCRPSMRKGVQQGVARREPQPWLMPWGAFPDDLYFTRAARRVNNLRYHGIVCALRTLAIAAAVVVTSALEQFFGHENGARPQARRLTAAIWTLATASSIFRDLIARWASFSDIALVSLVSERAE